MFIISAQPLEGREREEGEENRRVGETVRKVGTKIRGGGIKREGRRKGKGKGVREVREERENRKGH